MWFKNAKRYARFMYHRNRVDLAKNNSNTIKGGTAAYEAAAGPMVAEAINAYNLKDERFPDLMRAANRMQTEVQGAQTLTLQDALDLIDISSPICFIHCECRKFKYGYVERDRSKMTCLGLGIGMLRWERTPARYVAGAEWVDHDEAREWVIKWNKKGLVQNLMNFGMRNGGPYIGGLCNCSRADCASIENRLRYGQGQLIKGERVAIHNEDNCTGCYKCIQRCQFGAIAADIRKGKVQIDSQMCFGCGLCESACDFDAIGLRNRRDFPILRYDW
jgi:NAD-dependent dihydropyrimidine dehydrogenase PreA subunit